MSLAPWCANEKWTYGPDWAKVEGRERCPDNLKKDYAWWLRNDYEQSIGEAPWYHSSLPLVLRETLWSFRNPLQNANLFVFGVADRNYTVQLQEGERDPAKLSGVPAAMVIQRDDLIPPQTGWQRALLTLDDGSTRTWNSFVGRGVMIGWGCQPTGLFEWKLHPHIGK